MNDTSGRLDNLGEQVRKYSSALINYHEITPYKYPTKPKGTESVEVKLTGIKYSRPSITRKAKKKEKVKNKSKYTMPDALRDSLYSNGRTTSEAELAQLAEQAEEAIKLASQLIGEPAVYICGMLVGASTVKKDSVFRKMQVYKIINGW